MSVFKSTWFKCIACLLLIAVISGALLATLNDLLFVSPEMRTARAIAKIYGEEKEYSVELDVDDGDAPIIYSDTEQDLGSINKVYGVGDDLLFQATGYQGYKNGTITLWVQAAKDGESYSIKKVILQSFEKQTLMNNLSNAFYEKFTLTDITEMFESGNLFYADAKADVSLLENNVVIGATRSSTAAVNAVNCVIKYLGGERQ